MSWLERLLLPFRGRHWRKRWVDEHASHELTQRMLWRAQNELAELKGGPMVRVHQFELINYGEQLGEVVHYRLRCWSSRVPKQLFTRGIAGPSLCVDYRCSKEALIYARQPDAVLLTGIEQMGSQMGVQLAHQLVPGLVAK